ncbi:MAG: 16S rRNA (guanine(527)-N(7))-methyltransferase RsmG [Pyrinomonadaceae bacterium]
MNKPITAEFIDALESNASSFGVELSGAGISQLASYYELLLRWNPRLHLVAPCSPPEFATRHILESLLLVAHLPNNARVVDVGSGAGLPMLPCLIARSDLHATLIESSPKKTVFLREAVKHLKLDERATVIAKRFEDMAPVKADAITCRALDRFSEMLPRLIEWSPPRSSLFLFGGDSLLMKVTATGLHFESVHVPCSDRRRLMILRKPAARERLPD